MTKNQQHQLVIRQINRADAALAAEFFAANAQHFQPWEPRRASDYYQLEQLQQRLLTYEQQQQAGVAAYFIALQDQQLVAHCSLTQIVYGPFRAGYLGFGVAEQLQGKGVMTQLCRAVLDHAFDQLALHRVMANYLPHNQRSAQLLAKLGFSVEGLARQYLQINGQWQDHVLTALLQSDYCRD